MALVLPLVIDGTAKLEEEEEEEEEEKEEEEGVARRLGAIVSNFDGASPIEFSLGQHCSLSMPNYGCKVLSV